MMPTTRLVGANHGSTTDLPDHAGMGRKNTGVEMNKCFPLLRSYFFSFRSSRYARILMAFSFFLTAMAILLCLWGAPSDSQQGENSRILYVHVPAAWMSLLIYIAMAISSVLFLLTKHPFFQLLSGTGANIGALFTLFTLVTGGLWGKPMWGTFWVWDARSTSVLILFFLYLGALRFQQLSADVASIFICIGLIDIPIIKFSVNWWNTLHQPSSISQFGTSIHISMLIPILFIFASFLLLTWSLFLLETRKFILSSSGSSVKKRMTLLRYNIKHIDGVSA